MKVSFFPALEAIDFQKGSPLAVELTAAFQEVIDHREKFTVASERIKESVKYFTDITTKKIMAITKKYTGMDMKRVIVSKRWDFRFATRMLLGDGYGFNATIFIEQFCGNTDFVEYLKWFLKRKDINITTYEDMMKVTNSLNLSTGYISNLKLNNQFKCSTELLFDPYGAFCMKELHHTKVPYFTARELAAIVCHEIGHVVSLIEMARFTYFAMRATELAFISFDKNATPEDKKKFIVAMGDQLTKEQKQSLSNIEYAKDSTLNNIFVSLWALTKSLSIVMFPLVVVYKLASSIFKDNDRDDYIGMARSKNSDYKFSEKNMVYSEQLADQYAVRHGLGSALVTGLQKFDEYFSVVGVGRGSKTSSAVWTCKKIPCVISTLLDTGISLDEHERHKERFASILKEQLQIFKQDNLSPEALDFYISDYENTVNAIINKPKQESLENAVKAFYGVLEYVASTPRHLLGSARFVQEYNKLVENVQKLMNNNLYYRKAKLEQLLRK